MRKLIFLALFSSTLAHADGLKETDRTLFENLRVQVFTPYFEALVAGDVAKIAAFMPPDLFADYESLLTQNTTYPQYLRNHYVNTTFDLIDISLENGHYSGDVVLIWGDGRRSRLPLVVNRVEAERRLNQ